MPRPRTSPQQIDRAIRLSALLVAARQQAPMSQEALARQADVSLDTLRRFEQEHTVSPSFFFVAALASSLDLSLDDVAEATRRR
jgi:transcriptional regulator with XRE-family HTH domain